MRRIHVAGVSPRTGTTLLAEALVACFDIDLFAAHEARIFTPPPGPGRVFLTKAPRDILLAEAALRDDPSLHVICLLRDPRNVIVSRHRRAPNVYWAGLKFWKTYAPVALRLRDHPRFTTIRYEDLIENPDRTQADLKRRLPFLRETAPFSRFHEIATPSDAALMALGGVRPISAPVSDPWRQHLPRVAGQIALHGSIAQDLIAFGYETDDRWLQDLAGVTPDTRPGFWPEFFTPNAPRRERES